MPRNVIDPNLSSGELDRRVTLLQPVYNAEQDEIVDWLAVTDVWASVEPGGGMEITESDRTIVTAPVEITIRYRDDIDARWRVQDRQHIFEIKTASDVLRRRASLVLTCTEVL